MGTSLLEEAFKGYQNISEQCVEQTRLKLWFSFLKRIPDKLIYYKALDITEGKWKKKKASVSNMYVALCIKLFVIFEREKGKKNPAKSESWVIVPRAKPSGPSSQSGSVSPGFSRLVILLVGRPCN